MYHNVHSRLCLNLNHHKVPLCSVISDAMGYMPVPLMFGVVTHWSSRGWSNHQRKYLHAQHEVVPITGPRKGSLQTLGLLFATHAWSQLSISRNQSTDTPTALSSSYVSVVWLKNCARIIKFRGGIVGQEAKLSLG